MGLEALEKIPESKLREAAELSAQVAAFLGAGAAQIEQAAPAVEVPREDPPAPAMQAQPASQAAPELQEEASCCQAPASRKNYFQQLRDMRQEAGVLLASLESIAQQLNRP